jgi:hypothetical protein
MSKIEQNVAVHKAITLAKGESLRTFTSTLRQQGGDFLMRKLNLTEKSAGTFLVEVFDAAAVFEVFKFEGRERPKFFAVKYGRKDGASDFEFSDSTEVERVSTFRPKQTGVTKAFPVQKPFPNEHAARQADPKQFDKFRRQPMKGVKGVDAIFGIKDGKSAIQSLRFDKKLWTTAEAKAWLKSHGFKTAGFEAATAKHNTEGWTVAKEFWHGIV